VFSLEPGLDERLIETPSLGRVFQIGRIRASELPRRGWDSVPSAHVARHGFPETVFLRRQGEWQGLLPSPASFMSDSREGKRGW
jgi:hypothetical protein